MKYKNKTGTQIQNYVKFSINIRGAENSKETTKKDSRNNQMRNGKYVNIQ